MAMMTLPSFKPATPFRKQRSPVRAEIGSVVSQRLAHQPGAKRLARLAAQVFTFDHFLDDATCDRLIPMIKAGCVPSKLYGQGDGGTFRTSKSCNLPHEDPFIRSIDERIAEFLGLEPAQGETIQGQVYAVGQQFKPHPDFFHVDLPSWTEVERTGGQRTWTAMVYLNEPDSGGETHFPHLGITVAPKRGLLLTWNNMARDGAPNPWTFHEGCPVTAGEKIIITKWFRERTWC